MWFIGSTSARVANFSKIKSAFEVQALFIDLRFLTPRQCGYVQSKWVIGLHKKFAFWVRSRHSINANGPQNQLIFVEMAPDKP